MISIKPSRYFALCLALASTASFAQQNPASIVNRYKTTGLIDITKSGTVIQNVHAVNPNGPCIQIRPGVSNVTIRNSEIGPCGTNQSKGNSGVSIFPGSTNIVIQDNVFHDMATGVHAYGAYHPIVVDGNFFYQIRGPFPSGQAVQFQNMTNGKNSKIASKITCNMSDAQYGSASAKRFYEDHISIINTKGVPGIPVEIAYNRIRGASGTGGKSGSGMMLGDMGGAWLWAHDNVVYKAANTGIGVAGGNNIVIQNNKVDSRGDNLGSLTNLAFAIRGFSSCSSIKVLNNRGIARVWNWGQTSGKVVPGYSAENCSGMTVSGNKWGDTTLSINDFNTTPAPCR